MVFCIDSVDTKYKFTLVDIEDAGRQIDCGVYAKNDKAYATENDLINVPQSSKLPQPEHIFPYIFIRDDVFGLKNHFMKSYPFPNLSLADRVFNYRSSQSRFRVPNKRIIFKPTTIWMNKRHNRAAQLRGVSKSKCQQQLLQTWIFLIKITLQVKMRVNGE